VARLKDGLWNGAGLLAAPAPERRERIITAVFIVVVCFMDSKGCYNANRYLYLSVLMRSVPLFCC